MTRRHLKSIACCVIGVVAFAGCGGSDDEGASNEETSSEEADAADSDDTEAPAVTEAPAETEETTEAPVESGAAVDILTDFGDVCRGVTLPGATSYDPARAGVHPLIALTGEDPSYATSSALLPEQWAPVVGEEQTVELVVMHEPHGCDARADLRRIPRRRR